MASTSRNNLDEYEIERELAYSDKEFDNYDSDSDPEFLISDKEESSDVYEDENIPNVELVVQFLENDWSNTILNLGRFDYTVKSDITRSTNIK